MPKDVKKSSVALEKAGAGADAHQEAEPGRQTPTARQLDIQREFGEMPIFDLMLAELDARIDAVTAQTDEIMARAGLI